MSTSRFPRIYVRGEMSFDPTLANNFNVYDPEKAVLNRASFPAGMTLDEMRQALPTALRGSWNHFGTHNAIFETVQVTGVSTAPNRIDTTDGLVGKKFQLKGKLVDLNPATDNGTHVYFDSMQIGDFGGGLEARRDKRLVCRYLNFSRNIGQGAPGFGPASRASGVWEVCLKKSDVRFMNPQGSDALAALQQSFADPAVRGFSFRLHTYRTLYFQNGIKNQLPERPRTADELFALYADGKNFSNPAYSIVVGVISPWTSDEHTGHPAGRFIWAARPVPSLQNPLGNAFVEIDEQNRAATVDLGEVIPEIDSDLHKPSIGDLRIRAQGPTGVVELGTIAPSAYTREAYERTAGLVDLNLGNLKPDEWEKLRRGVLSIEAEGQSVLIERPLVAVVEDRDIYLDEGETASVLIRVMDRGVSAQAGTRVQVAEYDGTAETLIGKVGELSVDAKGEAKLKISAGAEPGFRIFVLDPYRDGETAPEPAPNYARASDFHVMVRTLPFDDALERSTPDSKLTWSWVYENVIAVFDVLNPVMSRTSNPAINRPLHDRTMMSAHAAKIKAAIDKSNIESASYMPVTRDLSRGKRKLLQRWCDLVLAGKAPSEPIEATGIVAHSVSERVLR